MFDLVFFYLVFYTTTMLNKTDRGIALWNEGCMNKISLNSYKFYF